MTIKIDETIKILLGLILFGIIFLGGFFIYVFLTATPYIPPITITGQSVWSEVNKIRSDKGLEPLELSEELCNGISDRMMEIIKNYDADGIATHKGFDEFAMRQWETKRWDEDVPSYVNELFVRGANTGEEAVNMFLSSPSHSLPLLNSEVTYGCAYSTKTGNEGWAIIFIS